MTTKDSICVKCDNLIAHTDCSITSKNGTRKLMSQCFYGGKCSGNRKTCKRFKQADEKKIEKRLNAFER